LAAPLYAGTVPLRELAKVQRRRTFPVRMTQAGQVFVQNRVIRAALASRGTTPVPWLVKLLQWFPFLRYLPARLIGVGIRPEHVRTPERATPRSG
jgi:hypothetical protein